MNNIYFLTMYVHSVSCSSVCDVFVVASQIELKVLINYVTAAAALCISFSIVDISFLYSSLNVLEFTNSDQQV